MSEWRLTTIKEMGRVVTGKTPPKSSPEYFDGEHLFVSPKDLDWDATYITDTRTKITKKALEKFPNQVIPKNSVMYTSLSFAFGKIGLASQSLLTNQQINSVITNKDHYFGFVYYLLRANRPLIFSYNSGIDTPIVPKSVFEKIKLPCPPLDIQKKITAVLSAYDDLIENNNKRIALLEKGAEEIYREWFVRLRFPGWETAVFHKGIPEGWEVVPLGSTAQFNLRSIRKGQDLDFINYVTIASVTTHQINEIENMPFEGAPGRARRILQHGDIIWSTVRPANRAYCLILKPMKNLIASTGFAVITANENIPYSFLYYTVTTNAFVEHIANVAKGVAYPAASTDDFKKTPILLPPQFLLEKFHELCEPIFEQKNVLYKQAEKLMQSRDLLLSRLISGKLPVDNLDIATTGSLS